MTQQQRQSRFSPQGSQSQSSVSAQDASLSRPEKPDDTSPYQGPGDTEPEAKPLEHVSDPDGPKAMKQPYFSEAQSTLGAFAPTERPGDPFAQPEDALGGLGRPTEQSGNAAETPSDGQAFHTAAGTIHEGMTVVDSYGHTIGLVSGVDGELMRLASTDPHDDGVAFLPVTLIDGIDGSRVLLAGRGDASFGMPVES